MRREDESDGKPAAGIGALDESALQSENLNWQAPFDPVSSKMYGSVRK